MQAPPPVTTSTRIGQRDTAPSPLPRPHDQSGTARQTVVIKDFQKRLDVFFSDRTEQFPRSRRPFGVSGHAPMLSQWQACTYKRRVSFQMGKSVRVWYAVLRLCRPTVMRTYGSDRPGQGIASFGVRTT